MGVGFGLYMYDVVAKRLRSLSHLLMSSCLQRGSTPLKFKRFRLLRSITTFINSLVSVC